MTPHEERLEVWDLCRVITSCAVAKAMPIHEFTVGYFKCPTCKAQRGSACVGKRGAPLSDARGLRSHARRQDAAAAAYNGACVNLWLEDLIRDNPHGYRTADVGRWIRGSALAKALMEVGGP